MLKNLRNKHIKHKMVDVDLIPLESFHIYYNNRFALQIYTHSQLYIDLKHIYL
jgi:hypothetical protein